MRKHALPAALIYCRVSSDEQANGLSLPTQLQECRRYAAFQPDWAIQNEYQE